MRITLNFSSQFRLNLAHFHAVFLLHGQFTPLAANDGLFCVHVKVKRFAGSDWILN